MTSTDMASASSPAEHAPTPRAPRARLDGRIPAAALLIVAFLVPALAFWPGLLSPDGNQTVYQANAKFATDWWTAFGAVALRGWNSLELGLGGAYGILLAVNVVGAYLCLRPVLRRVPAAAATILVVGFPPMYAQLSALSRDGYFLGFALLAFGLMAALPRVPARRHRWVIAGALLAALLCFWSRQNGIAVVLCIAFWAFLRHRDTARATLAKAFGVSVLTCVLALAGTQALYAVFDVRGVHAERFIYLYDLASISELTDHNQFPQTLQRRPRPDWVTPNVDQRTLDALWYYPNSITLFPNNRAGSIDFVSVQKANEESKLLRHAWVDAVTRHPFDYLWGRIRLAGSQLGLVHRPTDAFLGLIDNPNNFGHPMTFSQGYDAAAAVVPRFVGPDPWIPLDLPWTYLLVLVACTVVLWRRVRSAMAVAMTSAILLNILAMGVLAVASAFRYTNLGVPVACILLVHVLATTAWVQRRLGGLVPTGVLGMEDPGAQREERQDRD
jgi:hypothetical protein